jgi:hypothetical protein
MWFLSLAASWKLESSRSRRLPARTRFQPCLENLENRCVPSTLNVTSSADNGASGTLRWAVAQAQAGDTIDILVTQPITLTKGELYLGQNLTVEAPAGSPATISGGNLSRVFEVNAGSVTFDNLIITGGAASDGGGIYNGHLSTLRASRALTLNDCTVTGNSATDAGGGIYNIGAVLNLNNSTVSNSSAANDGGGIFSGGNYLNFLGNQRGNPGQVVVSNSTVTGNSATYGGGIYNRAIGVGVLDILGSSISGNSATYGGGVAADRGGASIYTSTLSGNAATYGGGVWVNGDSSVYACVVSNNRATADGGGIFSTGISGSSVGLGGDTFAGNTPNNVSGPNNVASQATTVTVSSSASTALSGESLSFTATVSAVAPGVGSPVGVVWFFDGSTLLGKANVGSNGLAKLTIPTLTNGIHGITAFYGGERTFLSSTSPILTETVTLPRAVVSSLNALEGTSGLTPFLFQIRLATPARAQVTYDVYTTDGTAKAGVNYVGITAGDSANGGTVTFAPGSAFATVSVYVITGSLPVTPATLRATFVVNLADPLTPGVASASGMGTITAQNAIPSIRPPSAQ